MFPVRHEPDALNRAGRGPFLGHSHPITCTGSGWFSIASSAMHMAMIESFRLLEAGFVEAPAAAAVAGDRVSHVRA